MSDEAAVLAEIARLQSAIEQHKHQAASGPSSRGRGSARVRGRGTGRGRGTHRNSTWIAPHLAQATPTSSRPSSRSSSVGPTPTAGPSSSSNGEVKARRGDHLETQPVVVPNGSSSSVPIASTSSSIVPPSTTPTLRPGPSGHDASTNKAGRERQVVIGGQVFVADPRGNKLVRKPSGSTTIATALSSTLGTPSTPQDSTRSSARDEDVSSTPRRTSHLGTTYIRTKTGNLVSLAFARARKAKADEDAKKRAQSSGDGNAAVDTVAGGVASSKRGKGGKRGRGTARGRGARGRGARGAYGRSASIRKPKPKSDKLCKYFQKTGQCQRAHTCPFVHDSTKISICPLFLRSKCPRLASTCPLSHSPNAHRSPHCLHFPDCTRPSCPYAHVVVSKDSAVCRDFVEYGWCDKGAECDLRHVRECWRFSLEGKCDVVGCKEPHILRRVHTEEEEDEEEDEDDEDEDADPDQAGAGETDGDAGETEESARPSKRRRTARRGASEDGISGAAGRRRLAKRARQDGEGTGLDGQDDFVELLVQVSDEDDTEGEEGDEEEGEEEEEEEEGEEDDGEEEEDEDGMSVDSDDLDSGDELPFSAPSRTSTNSTSARAAPLSTALDGNDEDAVSREKATAIGSTLEAMDSELELDYGSSGDEARPVESHVRVGEVEDDASDEDEDADVARLLGRA
ncbi:hypothetical protein JCM10212_004698 [Sporobolomyces blumeae]